MNPPPLNQLSTQCAVTIAKIARIDFPLDWPDLLFILTQTIQSTIEAGSSIKNNSLVQERALYTLHLVVKQLCQKTLPASRLTFDQVFYKYSNSTLKLIDLKIAF